MGNDLETLEDTIEAALLARGPLDVVELVAVLSVPPDKLDAALGDLLDAGRVEVVKESDVGAPVFRLAGRVPIRGPLEPRHSG